MPFYASASSRSISFRVQRDADMPALAAAAVTFACTSSGSTTSMRGECLPPADNGLPPGIRPPQRRSPPLGRRKVTIQSLTYHVRPTSPAPLGNLNETRVHRVGEPQRDLR